MVARPSSEFEAAMSDKARDLSGKVAFVTGSGRGMGREHALLMAERGGDILVHDILAEEAAETARRVRALGRRAHVATADMTDVAAVRAMAEEGIAALGRIDILVNNAGIADYLEIEAVDEAVFDRMFAVH